MKQTVLFSLMRFSAALLVLGGTLSILATRAAAQSHPLVWDSMEKTAHPEPGTLTAEYTFWVTNTSEMDVLINQVSPACGCTTPILPALPWKLAPGASGSFKAQLDLKGKSGFLKKSLAVATTAGPQTLYVAAQLPKDLAAAMGNRQANMALAKADRQAVFKGKCVDCHVTPTVGKMGEELFVSACAICHDPVRWAEKSPTLAHGDPKSHHRAEIVPDLSKPTKPRNRSFWKITIHNGGPPGTLMPEFSKRHGGPLTDEQIESLVDYAMKAFPQVPVQTPATTTTNAVKSAQAN